MRLEPLPTVIQGGMGVAVSGWQLAAAVARTGQLGVVSGTALDVVLARRLAGGDPDGQLRGAIERFPIAEIADWAIERYFRPGGIEPDRPYPPVPRLALRASRRAQQLTVLANFVEVSLAKQGHDGPIGINYLEKIQLATPAALYGAMLAGVDCVLMGAGIPRELPQLIDAFADNRPGSIRIEVAGSTQQHEVSFDPADWAPAAVLGRPDFIAIVASDTLASYLARDDLTRPDGFVLEGPTAGGHSAPPRGRLHLDPTGQPIYGTRDQIDPARIGALGLPFWLAGGYGSPQQLEQALALGANGIQAGTIFALCEESGLTRPIRLALLADLAADAAGRPLEVRNDPVLSPTGFPFKVVTSSRAGLEPITADRDRLCDLGFLRTPYLRSNGGVGYRCPGEPEQDFARKGGDPARCVGVACLCNALTANVGLGQLRPDGYREQPLITLGSELAGARDLLARHPAGWSAEQAIGWLLTGLAAAELRLPSAR